MNALATEVLMFIAGSLGWAIRGWIGKSLLSLLWSGIKVLARVVFRVSEDERTLYHTVKQSSKARGRS